MNIIRKLKLSEIIHVEWTIEEKEIIDLFDFWLKDLEVFVDPDKPHETNFMKQDGTFVLQQDEKNKSLFVRYEDFWEVFLSKYKMKYTDIQIFMKGMLKLAFKQQVYTPKCRVFQHHSKLELAFKQQTYTPQAMNYGVRLGLELAFK